MRPSRVSLRARPGFALATALAGIVVIGVLIGGVFMMSAQEVRITGGAVAQERAFRAAELGLNTALSQWDNITMSAAPAGAVTVRAYAGEGWTDTVRITKLTGTAYTLVSTAVVRPGTRNQATKSTGLAVRVAYADFGFLGALTVRGTTRIGGSSYINGYDTNPGTWNDCPAATDSMPGIAIGSAGDLTTSGCNDMSCVDGSPKLLTTPAANDTSTYFNFGDLDWASLTMSATKIYTGSPTVNGVAPAVHGDGSCNTGAQTNWGAPLHTTPAHACQNYFPIIHARGSTNTLKITGGRGQGILLVDGDLEISGGFEFFGPVIVRGVLKTTGTGGKITGGVMAANVDLDDQSVLLGDATVSYSNCVIEKAKAAAASPRRIAHRSWVDIH